ncbi:hypothetical protein IGB42_02112 [Andreprevotia sp. IGB-42]|nr:hypothetical protein IGB42_02112 [Andreprevotia sp. IGB-42]
MLAKISRPRSGPIRQAGVSLIEIMIALALGLLIIGAAFSYFLSTLTTSKSMLAQSKLQQDIRSTAVLIQRDLRRAGYAPPGNSNQAVVSTLWIGKATASATNNNCVIYRYVNEQGNLRNSGFILNADGKLYMKTAGADNTCQVSANWTEVTSATNVQVTNFSVVETTGNRPSLSISITGQLKNDPTVSLPLNLRIVLQNAPIVSAATTGT